jgi:ubiquinone/menaquinone biosynthesis C-methylase UbiE
VERYVIRGGREGYERLLILARAKAPGTRALFERVGIGRNMRCVDLGCGGGEVTFELALLVGRGGHVTGIDMDEVKLAAAREAAVRHGLGNVEFRTANVNDWNAASTYDVVYARFLLQHLSRPVDLIRRMWDAVAPGGALVVEDADFEAMFCEPPNAGFDFFRTTYPRVLERHGGDANSGRKLYRYFREAGVPDPDHRLVQTVEAAGEAKTLTLTTLEATAAGIVSEGLASEDEVNEALASLAAFTGDPETVIGDPRTHQVWARKPRA